MAAGTFALDIAKFAQKAKDRADEVVGAIVTRVAEKVMVASPVGDAKFWKRPPPKGYIGGHFRANWQMEIGSVPVGELAGVDPSGVRTLANITARIPDNAAGLYYLIANNAPYALRLEHGYSRQAPQGIVGLTVAQFSQIINQAIAENPQ